MPPHPALSLDPQRQKEKTLELDHRVATRAELSYNRPYRRPALGRSDDAEVPRSLPDDRREMHRIQPFVEAAARLENAQLIAGVFGHEIGSPRGIEHDLDFHVLHTGHRSDELFALAD